jgi:hypothetical protein
MNVTDRDPRDLIAQWAAAELRRDVAALNEQPSDDNHSIEIRAGGAR